MKALALAALAGFACGNRSNSDGGASKGPKERAVDRDVEVRGGLLVALVGDDKKSELVILTAAGDGYAPGVRHPLPAAFDRILD